MRIEVTGEGTISPQAKTYAEYRVFAALTQVADIAKVARVHVALRSSIVGNGCEEIACTVTVTLEGAESFRVRTAGAHAYAAINGAVDRIKTYAAASEMVDRPAMKVM